jgi:hypothetical protein
MIPLALHHSAHAAHAAHAAARGASATRHLGLVTAGVAGCRDDIVDPEDELCGFGRGLDGLRLDLKRLDDVLLE